MSGISDAWEHSTAVSSDFEKSDLEKTSQFNDSQESLQSGNFDFPVHPGVRPLEKNRHRPTKSLVEDPETQYPGPLPLALIVAGVCLSVFIISLDRSIITTVGCPKLNSIRLFGELTLDRPLLRSPINFIRMTISGGTGLHTF